jgi:penicillin-binding protein A
MTPANRSLNRITFTLLAMFALVAASLAYWSAFNADSILAMPQNPRLVEKERALFRGGLYDANGQPLAITVQVGTSISGKAIVKRQYTFTETANVVGYYSLVHGVGGAEAAYDMQLRGDDIRDPIQNAVADLVHQPQIGSDIRLTIDAALQKKVAAAIEGQQGAVVAIDVRTGKVLVMVSAPTFDPNVLDETFDGLQRVSTSPLLNRATQGLYQPGGALETVILATMLTQKADYTSQVPNTMTPVQAAGRNIMCAGSVPASTLHDAYIQACPSLFAQAAQLNPDSIQTMIDSFGLLKAPEWPNFGSVSGRQLFKLTAINQPNLLQTEGAGQGFLTVTPFQMAMVAATIANQGNGITPIIANAIRKSGEDWQPLTVTQSQPAIITADVANTIGVMMSDAVKSGAAKGAAQDGLDIHGHASIAYTGASQSGWFIGYIVHHDGDIVAVAVVIENADANKAAELGGLTLAGTVKAQ